MLLPNQKYSSRMKIYYRIAMGCGEVLVGSSCFSPYHGYCLTTSGLDITNNKEKILKVEKKRTLHSEVGGRKIRITADFLSETMEAKRQ